MSEVEILAGAHWILLGSLWFLDAFQVLAHCVDRAVHVQQLAIEVLLGTLTVRFATAATGSFSNN